MAQVFEGKVSSFADVQSQQNFQAAPVEAQAQIAMEYFNSRVATQPNFQAAPPEAQQQILQEFKTHYNVPEIKSAQGVFTQPKPTQAGFDLGQEFNDLYGSAANEFTAQITDLPVRDSASSGVGSFLGGLGRVAAGSLAGAAAGSVVPGIGNIAGGLYGGIAAAGLGGAGRALDRQQDRGVSLEQTNLAPVLGEGAGEAILQAIPGGNLVGKPLLSQLKTLGKNALIQGGLSGPMDAGIQWLENNGNVDWQRAIQAGLQGAGGSVGGDLFGKFTAKRKPRARVKGPDVTYGDFGRVAAYRSKGKIKPQSRKIIEGTIKFNEEVDRFQGVDEDSAFRKKAQAVKKAYEQTLARYNAERNPSAKKGLAKSLKMLQEKYSDVEQDARPPKRTVEGKTEKFNALVNKIADMRSSGRKKEAAAFLSANYTPETRARVNDAVAKLESDYKYEYNKLLAEERASQARQRELEKQQKAIEVEDLKAMKKAETEQQKLQKLKQKQAISDRIALEKAQSKKRAIELARLEADIKARDQQAKAEYEDKFKQLVQEEKASQAKQKALFAEQQRTQNLKDKQATADRIALEKAESKKRQIEINRLKADIQTREKAEYKRLVQEERASQAKQKALLADQQRIQNLKEKQAKSDAIALEKALSKKRIQELKQLKANIQKRSGESVANNKPSEPSNPTTEKKPVNIQKAKATIEQAIAEGKPFTVEHRAEKAGTRDESTFRNKFDLPYEMTTKKVLVYPDGEPIKTASGNLMSPTTQKAQKWIDNGDAKIAEKPAVRVINENGQPTWRYLEDMYGEVKISEKPHPYTYTKNADGSVDVFDAKGQKVEAYTAGLTKDSVLSSGLKQMEAVVNTVKKGGNVTAADIKNAMKGLDEDDFKKAMKNLSQEEINKLGKEVDC